VVTGRWYWDLDRAGQEQDCSPGWVPLTRTVAVLTGPHFQSVRVPAVWAEQAHAVLGTACGPIVGNALAGIWHFLLEPGSLKAGDWNLYGTRLVRPGTAVAVPPAFIVSGNDARWVVHPGQGTTDPADLLAALTGRPLPPAPARPVRGRSQAARR
jgi:hypothetical protein